MKMSSYKSKITTSSNIKSITDHLKKEGRSVGFTSGVFDLLHEGHVSYLENAAALCDVLIVGVNSDASVRENKGPLRPICAESERMAVVASLACVDYVFSFSELNNNQNIELLKPDIYIKAGDYSKSQLSSAPLVEAYGGRVELVSVVDGRSTSSIVDKILLSHSNQIPRVVSEILYEKKPAIFLDRDGTINEEVEYLHEPEKFKLIPGVIEALKLFSENGFRLVVVTNQPGIGLGYFTKEDFFKVNKKMFAEVSRAGISIDKVYFSPYSQADNSPCRKPNTAMIDRAVEELNIDLKNSYVIGDMTSDVMLARNVGCKSVLVKTGFAGADRKYQVDPDLFVRDLLEAAQIITQ